MHTFRKVNPSANVQESTVLHVENRCVRIGHWCLARDISVPRSVIIVC